MKKRIKWNYIAIGALLVVIIAVGVYYFSGTGIKEGDKIKVDYIGYLEDGKVFDTSIKEIAEKNDVFNELRAYEPLEFTVGNKEIIKGIDEGIIGMRKGSKKTLTIKPEDAYGEYDKTKLREVPLIEEINRSLSIDEIVEIPKEQFKLLFSKEAKLNEEINTEQVPWPLVVIEIGDIVKVKNNPIVGENYMISSALWNSSYGGRDGDKLVFKQNPENGMIVETAFGNAVITVSDDKIKIVNNPVIGRVTQYGKVSNVTKYSMMLDMNHPLAGKILKFEITIIDVIKSTADLNIFAKCLSDKAVFYGSFWCPHCKEQKEMFGEAVKYLNIVECDPKGENAKPEECEKNNIKGYPTWIIKGEQYSGVQSLEKLSDLTGCKLT